jgi:galactose-1-phosphate uridylyltransferase
MQKEVGHKNEVETTKWKVVVVENLTKVVMYDQMFQNQGEELFVVLNEAQLLMVQLYYLKECDMVIKFNVPHAHFRKQEEYEKI